MTNTVPYLILRDEPIGLHRLLPLQEDHIIKRGEGQRLGSDAAGNCNRREKQPLLKQTLRLGSHVNGLLHQYYHGGKNTFDRVRRHRTRQRWNWTGDGAEAR